MSSEKLCRTCGNIKENHPVHFIWNGNEEKMEQAQPSPLGDKFIDMGTNDSVMLHTCWKFDCYLNSEVPLPEI